MMEFLKWVLFLFSPQLVQAWVEFKPPNATILEINRETAQVIKTIQSPPNSDIVLGEEFDFKNGIRLECVAPYPIQWVYVGDGRPEFSSNTSTKWVKSENETNRLDFIAITSIGAQRGLMEQDTGSYICKSIQNPNVSLNYYFFISGPDLFTSPGGDNITLRDYESYLRIPCGVSHPNVTVSLQKSVNGLMNCPINDSISYNPKMGFILKSSQLYEPSGTYLCIGSWNRTTFRIVEYNVISKRQESVTSSSNINPDQPNDGQKPCNIRCGTNAECFIHPRTKEPSCRCIKNHTGNPFDKCYKKQEESSTTTPILIPTPTSETNEVSGRRCEQSSDCQSSQRCEEKICRDICPKSCGRNAVCEYSDHSPICTCREGSKGDPYTECQLRSEECAVNYCGPHSICRDVNKIISCVCKPRASGSPPNCRPECQLDRDCPKSYTCQDNTCKDPCSTFKCGENSLCHGVNKKPACSCLADYHGDPYTKCSRVKNLVGVDRSCRRFKQSPCGLNARCISPFGPGGRVECECSEGFLGDPEKACYPYESEPNCSHHANCPHHQICLFDKGKCFDPCLLKETCGSRFHCVVQKATPYCLNRTHEWVGVLRAKEGPCGPNAELREIDGYEECRCLVGYIGSPSSTQGCISHREYTNSCSSDEDCSLKESCFGRKCEDPCNFYQCASPHLQCKTYNHKPKCVRIQYVYEYTPAFGRTGGDRAIDIFGSTIPNPNDYSGNFGMREKAMCNLKCGENAHCLESNGKEYCNCIRNSKGDPYVKCRFECKISFDCPVNTFCDSLTSTCDDPCKIRSLCGLGAQCVFDGILNCSCPDGTKGNPYIRCEKEIIKTYDTRIKNMTCEGDEDCPMNKACFLYGSEPNICRSPCDYLKCGRFAKCRVSNHKSQCFCPEGFTGDPFNTCHKAVGGGGTPLHRKPCEDDGTCGLNAKCIIEDDLSKSFCICEDQLVGDPYTECGVAINCKNNDQCPINTQCNNGTCIDPCSIIGSCGVNQECRVEERNPVCVCRQDYLWKLGSCYPKMPFVEYLSLPPSKYFYPKDFELE